MTNWFETADGLWSAAWDEIASRAETRLWTLATVDADGGPQQRTIVLRGAEPTTLQFHTDLGSSKIAHLRRDPRAGLLCWLPNRQLQLRINAAVTIRHGADVADIWDAVPDASREAYGAVPASGQPIDDALAYAKPANQAAFAVLDCAVDTLDVLHLGADHRRVIFSRDGDWRGQWVAP
ncbi:MAG: pyridoxamine 5'-phosphate oxidase family protein [Yoonia sp.]|jgi:pyridoxine/pyridoxamine 5'-phosphate oxidase|nr:pyridoxamine 5'-phosphate oxidase family protein [Yoonia sp.]MDG1768039.1 pyridoxamine 5'-phosphate oxidase family protein [Yoonia sp.]